MKEKARLIITTDCSRGCVQCCNTYKTVMDGAKIITDLKDLYGYRDILITGGEPAEMDNLPELITQIRDITMKSRLYLYTALYNDTVKEIMDDLLGVHYTIHKDPDDSDLMNLEALEYDIKDMYCDQKLSFRLCVDSAVDDQIVITPSLWDRIQIFPWMTEKELCKLNGPGCLPEGEELLIYKPEGK